eukprot:m.344173 g.344173  ORF g.344173 m.344173 type:complete len:175 (-) comp23920_c0_seq1:277-801(-)
MADLPQFDIPWETLGIHPDDLMPPGIPFGCDSEVFDVLTRDAWDEYARRIKNKAKDIEWDNLPMREAPYENGLNTGFAQITAWRSNNGDRFELWSVDGQGSDVDGDRFAVLELHTGEKLIVGCMLCHPYVCCNVVGFANSDGSSEWEELQGNSAAELLEACIQRATTYLFDQDH